MNVPLPPEKKMLGYGFTGSLVPWIVLVGMISNPLLHAQDNETKATAAVTVGGITPMGEVRIELPAGTALTIDERVGDTLKVHKGPFRGNVLVRQTTLWVPTPAPSPLPSAFPSPTPEIEKSRVKLALAPYVHALEDLWRNSRASTLTLLMALALLVPTVFFVLFYVVISRRAAIRHQEQILKNELELVRRDLQELHTLLDSSRKQSVEVLLQQPKGDIASCPHCDKTVLLSSLQKGANTCVGCGGEFLYE
jgi:hypothetical protein